MQFAYVDDRIRTPAGVLLAGGSLHAQLRDLGA
jgi:hypothetical protein